MSKVFTQYLEFKRSAINHSAFHQWMGDKHTIIAVTTNDMAVTLKRTVNILKLKGKIKKHWEITDHRPISWFLGFEIKQDQKA